jgi:hypothetical protein
MVKMVTVEMVSDLANAIEAEVAKLAKLREDEEGLPCDLGMTDEEWNRLEAKMEDDALSWWVSLPGESLCYCCGESRCNGACDTE